MDGHGLTASASLGLNLGAPRDTVQHASETGKPQQDSSPTSQNHPSKKCLTLLSDALKKDEERPTQLPDITWQAASKLLKGHHLTRPWTNSFRLAWIELRGPEGHRSTCIRNRETPAGFKPNPPKPSVEKLPDVAFWRPKERWQLPPRVDWT